MIKLNSLDLRNYMEINTCERRVPIKKYSRNNKQWDNYNYVDGKIFINGLIKYSTEEERISKTNALRSALKNGELEITGKYQTVELVTQINENLTVSNFTLEFNWDGVIRNSRTFIVPLAPIIKDIEVYGKHVTLILNKPENTEMYEIQYAKVGTSTYSAPSYFYDNIIIIEMPIMNIEYSFRARAISVEEMFSDYSEIKTAKTGIVPNKPTLVTVSMVEKSVTINFTKGLDAVYTELEINDEVYYIDGTTTTVDVPDKTISYTYNLRSVSSTNNYSECVTGKTPLIPTEPTNIIKTMVTPKLVSFDFTKGINANSTPLEINGQTYNISPNTFAIDLPLQNTAYPYKMRSQSLTGHYSAYVTGTITTGTIVVEPACPSSIVINQNYKQITFSFVKGTDAVITELEVTGPTVADKYNYSITGTSQIVTVLAENAWYSYKLRSKSSTGVYSSYVGGTFQTSVIPLTPTVPTSITTTLVSPKLVSFDFTKGTNANSTLLEINAQTYNISPNTFAIDLPLENTAYPYKMRSQSLTGHYSAYVTGTVTTGIVPIKPCAPTNIEVLVNLKQITFNFTKGINAVSTELKIIGTTEADSYTYSITGTSQIVTVLSGDTLYSYKLYSKSSTGHCDGYVTGSFTSGASTVIPSKPTTVTTSINLKNITFNFVKGINAVSTELIIDGETYNITGTSKLVTVLLEDNVYPYTLRSISSTGHYSDYISGTVKSGVAPITPIVPTPPSSIGTTIQNATEVIFHFTMGTNAIYTLLEINGIGYILTNEDNSVILPLENTAYPYKLKSISSTGHFSTEVLGSITTRITPSIPTNITTTVNLKTITFNFTMGANAKYTNLTINGATYTITTGTTKTVTVPLENTEYQYSLRSVSAYSDFGQFVYGTVKSGYTSIIPEPPYNIETEVNGKNAIISFESDINAFYTVLRVSHDSGYNQTFDTQENSFSLTLPYENSLYYFTIYSVSTTGHNSIVEQGDFLTEYIPIVPTVPTNLGTLVNVKDVTFTFTKGTNTLNTLLEIIDFDTNKVISEHTISGTSKTITLPLEDTQYPYRMRSISSVGIYSAYVENYFETYHVEIIPTPPTAITTSVNVRNITFNFTKGTNAVNTILTINGTNYTISGTSQLVTVPAESTAYPYTLKSVSSTGNYSTIVSGSVTSGRVIIIPTVPINITTTVNVRNITFNFTKGTNAFTTTLVIGGSTYVIGGTTQSVIVPSESTAYTYTLQSTSSTGDCSTIVSGSVTSGRLIIIPTVPTNITTSVNVKDITFNFTKGTNAANTTITINGTNYTTTSTSQLVTVPSESTAYPYTIKSTSTTGDCSTVVSGSVTSGRVIVIPTAPTNVTASINVKNITFNFTKGTNAVSTILTINGTNYTTSGISQLVTVPAENTAYTYTLKSVSSTGDYSTIVNGSVTSGIAIITPTVPTNISTTVNEKMIIFSFTKGTNALNTILEIDGSTYTISGISQMVYVSYYLTNYTYKLRSVSSTGTYSTYVTGNVVSGAYAGCDMCEKSVQGGCIPMYECGE